MSDTTATITDMATTVVTVGPDAVVVVPVPAATVVGVGVTGDAVILDNSATTTAVVEVATVVVAPTLATSVVAAGAQGPSGSPGTIGHDGLPGPSGATGATGATGAAGGNVSFTFAQPSASASWLVVHNLNRFPSVTVVDSAGSVVEGTITYLDSDTLRLDFSAPFSGSAYAN